MNHDFIVAIGAEIHIQLATKSKMFCSCDNDSINRQPNTNICPICLGYPGTLPVINKEAVQMAIKMGLALNAQIAHLTKFDRKNYFYPDLPKGYQISQFDQPIVGKGYVQILVNNRFKKIGITRAHLEEDAAKLIHPVNADYSLVDFNRSGTPLIEVVSEPDMQNAYQAKRFLQEIYNIAMSLKITNGDMEHGNFKFDLNISVRPLHQKELGTKVEIKNLNSFRNAERALNFEINRQIQLIKQGKKIEQETRGWDDAKGITVLQRSKEESQDYRYFPEPDLPPLKISKSMIDDLKKEMPVLPIEVRRELKSIGLGEIEQDILISQPQTALIFNDCYQLVGSNLSQQAANWLVGDYQALINKWGEKNSHLTGQNLAQLIKLVDEGKISTKMAKDIFPDVVRGEKPSDIIQRQNLNQISDSQALEDIVKSVISSNPQAQQDFKLGKQQALGFLVGKVMEKTKGQANPRLTSQIMLKLLKE